jgi:hypothetical protein
MGFIMPKKYILIAVGALVFITPVLLFLFIFVFDKDINETFDDILAAHKDDPRATFPDTVARGQFMGTAEYFAGGAARLIKFGEYYYLRFENDFKVFRSPDSYVYLGSDDYYSEDSRIAELKGNAGSQNYLIPSEISPLEYNRIWIWSKSLETVLGSAPLELPAEKLPAHDVKKSKLEENAG